MANQVPETLRAGTKVHPGIKAALRQRLQGFLQLHSQLLWYDWAAGEHGLVGASAAAVLHTAGESDSVKRLHLTSSARLRHACGSICNCNFHAAGESDSMKRLHLTSSAELRRAPFEVKRFCGCQ